MSYKVGDIVLFGDTERIIHSFGGDGMVKLSSREDYPFTWSIKTYVSALRPCATKPAGDVMDSVHIALDARVAALEMALERVTKQRDDAIEMAFKFAMKHSDVVDRLINPIVTYSPDEEMERIRQLYNR